MTRFLIFQVRVAGPCDILVCGARVYPALEGVSTFSADYFPGECITLLIFIAAFFNPDAGINCSHLHGASFIDGFAGVASTKEKAIGTAIGAVGGLVS